jgi:hypothetical protein
MNAIYKFTADQTANNLINELSLKLEVRASGISNFISAEKYGLSAILVEFDHSLSDQEELDLVAIVAAHTGEKALVDEASVESRELKIREMTEMAILHPLLNKVDAVEYLTSIDNWFNAWKRCGIYDSLIAKITADALDTNHPQHTFLNETVNVEGNKTYEFLIGSIIA